MYVSLPEYDQDFCHFMFVSRPESGSLEFQVCIQNVIWVFDILCFYPLHDLGLRDFKFVSRTSSLHFFLSKTSSGSLGFYPEYHLGFCQHVITSIIGQVLPIKNIITFGDLKNQKIKVTH